MARTPLSGEENSLLGRLPALPPGVYRALPVAAVVLGLGLLAAGVYVAPRAATLGLVFLGLGVPLTLLLWNRPEWGLVSLIFLTSSFLPSNIVDIRLPIGGGFDLRDLVLIGLFGLIFMRELTRGTLRLPWWSVSGPMLLFLALAVFSTFYAIAVQDVESHWALNDLRILSMYAAFFIVLWAIRRPSQLMVLLMGLFIVADLTTLVIYLQQILGADQPILAAMTSVRDWRVYQEAGAVRVIPAGHVLMHYMWFIALGLLVFSPPNRRVRTFYAAQLLFLGGGHLLAYTRAQWIAMGVGIVLLVALLLPRYWQRIVTGVVIGIIVLVLLGGLIASGVLSKAFDTAFVEGVTERFGSLFTPTETVETDSLEWRTFETGKAMQALAKQPLTGVGLGNRYREVTAFQGESSGWMTRGSIVADEVSRFTRYVHNSYMSILVKMGVPGLAALLWVFAAALFTGFRAARHMPEGISSGVVLGALLATVGLLIWAYFHPHLIKAESTPVIGLMLGLIGSQVTRREQG